MIFSPWPCGWGHLTLIFRMRRQKLTIGPHHVFIKVDRPRSKPGNKILIVKILDQKSEFTVTESGATLTAGEVPEEILSTLYENINTYFKTTIKVAGCS